MTSTRTRARRANEGADGLRLAQPPEPLDHIMLMRAALGVLDDALATIVAHERDTTAAVDESLRGIVITDPEIDALLRAPRRNGASSESNRFAGRLWGRIAPVAAAMTQSGTRPPIDLIRERFGLGTFETECLITCLAPELDAKYERLFGYLNDDVTRRAPSVQLLLRLLTPRGEDPLRYRSFLMADAPLLRAGLLAPVADARGTTAGMMTRCLRVENSVTRFLLDERRLDPELQEVWYEESWPPRAARLWAATSADARPSVAEEIERLLDDVSEEGRIACVLRGRNGSGRLFTVKGVCAAHGLGLLPIDCTRLLRAANPELVLRRIFRDSVLHSAAVYFGEADTLLTDRERGPELRALLERQMRDPGAIVFFAIERNDATSASAWFSRLASREVSFLASTTTERAGQWRELLRSSATGGPDPAAIDALSDEIAPKFRLTAGQIARVVERVAGERVRTDAAALRESLHAHASRIASPTLGDLAQCVTARYRWDDLVLPESRMELLREVLRHVRFRRIVIDEWHLRRPGELGSGVTALLFGEPGTGKSMAAQVLAGELGMALFRIDLSAVVSKYIGETEKNLARIFREADHTDAILFFDEADALFGKRSEVRDAHDRYANIEINYLLQQMEQYCGIALLATNQRQSLDDAFLRRIQLAIEFPMPSASDRLRIWELALPRTAPLASDLDLPFLARTFELSGGNIHNIALSAALLAAANSDAIAMEHLAIATHRELEKIGKRGLREEFGEYFAFVERASAPARKAAFANVSR